MTALKPVLFVLLVEVFSHWIPFEKIVATTYVVVFDSTGKGIVLSEE